MLATAKSVLDSAAEFFGRGIAAEAETPTVNLEAPDTDAAGTALLAARDKIPAKTKNNRQPVLNCTPFVRQYGILSNKWGVLLCQKEYQTNDIRRNSKNW